MASRIFWILIAGVSLVTGMVIQDGGKIFGWTHDSDISSRIDRRVDQAVDRSVRKMQVIDSRGREIDVPEESKRALADAVGRLVKAEADYAVLRIRDGDPEKMGAAKARRDHARVEVDQLKDIIKQHEQGRDAVREQIRHDVREDIRETVRDAVRN